MALLFGEGQTRKVMASSAVVVSVIVYGSAIHSMRTYPSRISGASAEVSRNRNAAWPFGVATLGMLVPVLIAIASASNWSRDRARVERASRSR